MTLLSRRKRRTTARRITPATLAVKLAALVALAATPVVAQPPPAGGVPPKPAAGNVQPNGLALPPGYRPRTPPPQAQPQPARPAPAAPGANAGKIMYFQKPADAVTVPGTEAGGEVVRPNDRVSPASAAVPAAPEAPAPAPLPPAPRFVPPTVPAPAVYQQPEPDPVEAKKQYQRIPPVDDKYLKLPPKENIFMVYNDLELEKAILERSRQDQRDKIVQDYERNNKGAKPTPEYMQQQLDNQAYMAFPALPVLSPPGVAYQSKTASYPPAKMILEPGYVVHRRLHFEEKNGERAGWDLGPLSVVVGATYFYRDVLLWPQSLASGCVTGFWDTSAGKCLPGSPSPYYLYPAGLTVSGTAFETLVVTGAAFIFP